MSLQVLLLMAGRGARFSAAGYATSKPLIEVDGAPMFVAALAGLGGLAPLEVVAVVREDQVRLEGIDAVVRAAVPGARLAVLPGVTRGAAESARAATDLLDPAAPVVVLDCDLTFRSAAYNALVRDLGPGPGAALLTFEAHDPRYGFVREDADGRVVEIAEKRAISDRAVAGAYAFSSAALLADAADRVMAGGVGELGEFYLSAVVAEVIARGADVRAAGVDSYASFGTPEELDSAVAAR